MDKPLGPRLISVVSRHRRMTQSLDPYKSKAIEAFEKPQPLGLGETLCSWTDLLGFGSTFFSSGWNPSLEALKHLYRRITAAQRAWFRSIMPTHDFALALNDGLVRCTPIEKLGHLDLIAMWLRASVFAHLDILHEEKAAGWPGARTVITYGLSLQHSVSELRFDDFILTYTKPDPTRLSQISKAIGNPLVFVNPLPLQLNLAFARAYLLDAGGSRIGLSGPRLFVDHSFLDFILRAAPTLEAGCSPFWSEEETHFLFAVPYVSTTTRYHFGLELEKPPIEVKTPELSTTVYALRAFYPHDEDLPFKIEIDDKRMEAGGG